ncbi:MAG TPA: CAP domain-containing protein [Pyrinomonadaceae bacterium]|jgi:uncharacterized protein YkwD
MNYNSFPQTPVCRRTRTALIVSCLLLAGGLFSSASGQANQSRPVARLIASANHAIAPVPSRPRTVNNERANAHASAVTPTPAMATMDERRAFDLINAARRAHGYAPLSWDAEAARMARQHSDDMARQNYLAHEGPDGRSPLMRARALGLSGWAALAENIAYNQGFDDPSGFAVERWLKSEKHRDNIMRAGFTHTGLGVARTPDGRVYFTQVFIAR